MVRGFGTGGLGAAIGAAAGGRAAPVEDDVWARAERGKRAKAEATIIAVARMAASPLLEMLPVQQAICGQSSVFDEPSGRLPKLRNTVYPVMKLATRHCVFSPASASNVRP